MKKLCIMGVFTLLAGCINSNVEPAYTIKPYHPELGKTLAWNFYQEADYYLGYCDLIAQTGYQRKNPDNPQTETYYDKKLSQCVNIAQQAVNKTYQQVVNTPQDQTLKPFVQLYYDRWKDYIAVLAINQVADASIVMGYKRAKTDLKDQLADQ